MKLMKKKEIKKIIFQKDWTIKDVINYIKETIREILMQDDGKDLKITNNMSLIGSNSLLDSMKLVELCITLEDKASEIGFEFDWTSETTMSKSRSMLRSINTLAEEFVNQFKTQK
jgi:acyl carrier protein